MHPYDSIPSQHDDAGDYPRESSRDADQARQDKIDEYMADGAAERATMKAEARRDSAREDQAILDNALNITSERN